MSLEAVANKRLYQQVAERMAERVQNGTWRVGERLPNERDLAALLNVSRPTVREALIVLELKGLIEVRSGAGTFVRGPRVTYGAAQDLPDDTPPLAVLEARMATEAGIAAFAASQASEADLAALHAANDALQQAVAAGVTRDPHSGRARLSDAIQRHDRAFHLALAAASGNAVLVWQQAALWDAMHTPARLTLSQRARLHEAAARTVKDHAAIIEAVAARDVAAATAAVHSHLRHVAEALQAAPIDIDAALANAEAWLQRQEAD